MDPLYLLTLLVAAGVAVQWIAARFRFPALLMLLATGLMLGPVTGLVDPEKSFGELLRPVVALAVAIVLFEGGLSLNLREARHVGSALRRLLFWGLAAGFGLGTLFGVYVAGLSLEVAAVLGAILVVTGPTVIIPMLRNARIAMRPATLLKWEGIVNDPLGALLAYLALEVSTLDHPNPLIAGLGLLAWSVIAGGIGALAGYLLGRALNGGLIPEHLKSPVILAAAMVVYTACDALQEESGLLAVTLTGLVLGNVDNASIEDIRRFKEQVTTLLVSLLFIVLSARLDLESLRHLVGPPLWYIACVLFVIRPIVGFLGTMRSGLPWQERALISWIAPRGVVAAAVAGAFGEKLIEQEYGGAELLLPIVFGVILATVLLHGLTVRPLTRRLGLAAKTQNGILMVGASLWAVSLAQALVKAGAFVVLADTRYRRVSQARLEGLEVHYGDVLDGDAVFELPMERVSWLLAASDDDAYNALTCLHFAPDLGREKTLQLTPAAVVSGKDVQAHMSGRWLWGDDGSYRSVTRRFWKGESFKVTSLTAEFDYDALVARNPNGLFLFAMHQGRLNVIERDRKPPTGATVIYLA